MTTTPEKTILLVDNDEDWLALLSRLVAAAGYRVLTANTCAAAIRLADRERPHAVVADLNLDCESGMTLCCHVKASPELKGVPVVILSGMEPAPTACGCAWDAFVCKADGTARLLLAIKRLLA